MAPPSLPLFAPKLRRRSLLTAALAATAGATLLVPQHSLAQSADKTLELAINGMGHLLFSNSQVCWKKPCLL